MTELISTSHHSRNMSKASCPKTRPAGREPSLGPGILVGILPLELSAGFRHPTGLRIASARCKTRGEAVAKDRETQLFTGRMSFR